MALVARPHDARDDLGERAGRLDRLLATRLDDGARDGAGVALLAQRGDDGGELALAGARDDVGRARAGAPHAHVERAVEAEREAALGVVELHRGDAEIEHDAVDRGAPCRAAIDRRDRRTVLDQRRAGRALRATSVGAARDRVADRDRCRSRARPAVCQDRARVAAGAECGVDIDAAVTHREPLDGAAASTGM